MKSTDNIMDELGLSENMRKEIRHYAKTKIPRCHHCRVDMVLDKERSGKYHKVWKTNCEHSKHLRMCVG